MMSGALYPSVDGRIHSTIGPGRHKTSHTTTTDMIKLLSIVVKQMFHGFSLQNVQNSIF